MTGVPLTSALDGGDAWARYTAGTARPVRDDARHDHAEPVIEPTHTDRLDTAAMEHERQSRLRRWQELRP